MNFEKRRSGGRHAVTSLYHPCRNAVMTRLYGIGHALVPMRQTTFAIRHEKADSGGYIAYVTGWGPHILGDVHTRQRASRFKARCKNTWCVGENYQWRCVFRTMRPNFKMWPNVTRTFVLSDRYRAYASQGMYGEKIYDNENSTRIVSPTEPDSILTTWPRPLLEAWKLAWSCNPIVLT